MGILDRFFGVREEITARVFEETSLRNAAPTYRNDFIRERAWFQDIPSNQAKMVRMNPWAWALFAASMSS